MIYCVLRLCWLHCFFIVMWCIVLFVVCIVLYCVLRLCWLFVLCCIVCSGYDGCFVLFALRWIVWCSVYVRCLHCVVLGTKVMLVVCIVLYCVLRLCLLFPLCCIVCSGCVGCIVLIVLWCIVCSDCVGCFVLFALCCIVWCSGYVGCLHCVVL